MASLTIHALSPDEAAVVCANPIAHRLDDFRSDPDVRYLVPTLAPLPAAKKLPSRRSAGHTLSEELLSLPQTLPALEGVISVLYERVLGLDDTQDADIWSTAYALVAPCTPQPQLRPISPTLTRVKDTPLRPCSGSVINSSEHCKNMDSLVRRELSGCYASSVPEFIDKLFVDAIPQLKERSEKLLDDCKLQGQYDAEHRRWAKFPDSPKETDVASWLLEITETIREGDYDDISSSRVLHSTPNKPLQGSKAKRKLDIGFVRKANAQSSVNWNNVLIPGELKCNVDEASSTDTKFDIARYVREVYSNQDTRRFVHGFTLCGDEMTVYLFDRGAYYSAPKFSINGDGLQFVIVMLGYLLMSEEQLGIDTSVQSDGQSRFVEVANEKIVLNEQLFRQPGIVCRGTTCWRATAERTKKKLVVKDSWQQVGCDESALLREVTAAGVKHVAAFHAEETVQIAGMDDNLLDNVRRGLDIETGSFLRDNTEQNTTSEDFQSSQTASSCSTRPKKRPSSSWPGNDGKSGSKKKKRQRTDLEKPQDRVHKRIVMTMPGKPLHYARTRRAVLQGLIDALSGHQSLYEAGVLHRDISIGNVLLSDDETNGFLIDLDHAIKVDRVESSGAGGRTGTPAFIAIGVIDPVIERPHSFMDDVESIFWLLFWICIHYRWPGDYHGRRTEYEDWNFMSDRAMVRNKGYIAYSPDFDFRKVASMDFTPYYVPLVPCVAELKEVIFPGNAAWVEEDMGVYERAKDVLRRAMETPELVAECKEKKAGTSRRSSRLASISAVSYKDDSSD